MNEESAELLDSELLKDAEATAQRPALDAGIDELKTARLVSITPPPPATNLTTSAMAPLPSAFPPPGRVPSMPVGTAPTPGGAPSSTRPSWLHALLQSTFPPPAPGQDPRATHLSRRAAGVACVGLALTFALVAMITGLRGVPDDPSVAPVVVAALVIARALVALGAGAFSFGLLRMAERLISETV